MRFILFKRLFSITKAKSESASKTKLNNSGFTLLETMIGFVLLGIIIVAASQVIASNTEVYYDAKSVSYGIQISQAITTEIRGDIENAQAYPLLQYDNSDNVKDFVEKYPDVNIKGKYVALTDNDSNGSCETIEFINTDGKQITFSLFNGDTSNILFNKKTELAYTDKFSKDTYKTSSSTTKEFDSKYIGMGYTIKDISFSLLNKINTSGTNYLCNCPVIKIEVTVSSDKWGDYTSTDYAALYSMYDMSDSVVYQQP